jgi:hypothetical protein
MNSNSPLLRSWLCQLLIALGAAGFASTTAAAIQLILEGSADVLVGSDAPTILVIAHVTALFTLPGIVLWLIASRVSAKKTTALVSFWSPQLLMTAFLVYVFWTAIEGRDWIIFVLVCFLAASGGAYVALLVLERLTARRSASQHVR